MTDSETSYGIIPFSQSAEGALQFLVVKHQKGHWGFPKGHAESEESEQEAALRELQEETGISQCILLSEEPITESYVFTAPDGSQVAKSVVYFLGRVDTSHIAVQPEEVVTAEWMPPERAHETLTFDESRALLDKALARLDGTQNE